MYPVRVFGRFGAVACIGMAASPNEDLLSCAPLSYAASRLVSTNFGSYLGVRRPPPAQTTRLERLGREIAHSLSWEGKPAEPRPQAFAVGAGSSGPILPGDAEPVHPTLGVLPQAVQKRL